MMNCGFVGSKRINNFFGKIGSLYRFDSNEYQSNKNIVSATVVSAPKTMETLKMTMLLVGNDPNYDLLLANVLKTSFAIISKLAHVCFFCILFVLFFHFVACFAILFIDFIK